MVFDSDTSFGRRRQQDCWFDEDLMDWVQQKILEDDDSDEDEESDDEEENNGAAAEEPQEQVPVPPLPPPLPEQSAEDDEDNSNLEQWIENQDAETKEIIHSSYHDYGILVVAEYAKSLTEDELAVVKAEKTAAGAEYDVAKSEGFVKWDTEHPDGEIFTICSECELPLRENYGTRSLKNATLCRPCSKDYGDRDESDDEDDSDEDEESDDEEENNGAAAEEPQEQVPAPPLPEQKEQVVILNTKCPGWRDGNLTAVNLLNTDVTDIGVEVLATHNKNLMAILLTLCRGVTDIGLEVLATHNKNFKTLDLCGTGVTDKGVEVLATNNKNLDSVVLTKCTGVTDKGVKVLAINCKNLTAIGLRGTKCESGNENKLRNKGIKVFE